MKAFSLAIFVSLFGFAPYGLAQNLTYNTANPGWFAINAWSTTGAAPFDTGWTAGSNATFIQVGGTANDPTTVTFNESTTIGNLTLNPSGAENMVITSATPQTLTFNGGNIDLQGTTRVLRTFDSFSIQGDFTKLGAGVLSFETSTVAYGGTATLDAGRIQVNQSAPVGSNSNFIINAGVFQLRNNNTYNLGEMTINGGTFELGRNNTNLPNLVASVTQLSGSGGNIQAVARTSTGPGTSNLTLNINQSTNTTYTGNINGFQAASNNDAFLTLNKQGSGSLTLSGSIDLRRITTVSAGTLLINSSNATFTNGLGTTAIAVNATLGGTGTLEIVGGDNVVLGATGSLQAGLAGSAGQTTFHFSSGGVLDLSDATDSSNTGWLRFALGAAATPGTTYDRILLTGTGSLNIGTGLNFSDFDFTDLPGFGPGTYVLFDTPNTILGTLGTTAGTIDGYDVQLSFGGSGTNLVLDVIPEPRALALLGIGLAAIILRLRRTTCR